MAGALAVANGVTPDAILDERWQVSKGARHGQTHVTICRL